MSFFDDMSNAFDSAVKFTGDKVSEQKLRFRISSLKSDISKDYETLGRMYHDNLKNGTENGEEINNLIGSIEEKKRNIVELLEKIDASKNTLTCVKCGAKNPDNSIFCCKCGEKF